MTSLERIALHPLAALALALCACGAAPPRDAAAAPEPAGSAGPAAAPAPRDLALSFKLDPRLSGPTYGGERWVSPPTFTGASGQDVIEARAEALEASGAAQPVDASWTSADPEVVSVDPAHGARAALHVKRAGETSVTVSVPGLSKELLVKARGVGGLLQVDVVQRGTLRTGAAVELRARPAGLPSRLADRDARASYAIGLTVGRSLRKRGVEVDDARFTRGARDGLAGRAPPSDGN